MSRFQTRNHSVFFSIVVLCSLSSTITIIPDILTFFSVNYVGYTLIPGFLFFLILTAKKFNFTKHIIYYYLVFILIYVIGLFAGLVSGQKSLMSSIIFLFAFTSFVFFSSTNYFKNCHKKAIKLFSFVTFIISLFTILTFFALYFDLTSTEIWSLEHPLNEKFQLKHEKLGDNIYSFVCNISLVLTENSKLLLGLGLNRFGDFCGLSYEASLGLLFSSVGFFFSMDHFKTNRIFSSVFLLVFLGHVLLGLSLTNVLSLGIVFCLYMFIKFNKWWSKIFLILVIILIITYAYEIFSNLSIVDYKLNSRSYEDSSSSIFALFSGGILGEGIFTQNYNPGILTSALFLVYYFMIYRLIIKSISIKKYGTALGLIYMVIHSLKFPFIFLQLPFAFWIPILCFFYINFQENKYAATK